MCHKNSQTLIATVLTATLLFTLTAVCADPETYRLGKSGQWQKIPDTPKGASMRQISKIKQFIETGKVSKAKKAVADFRVNYSGLSTYELDAFDAFIEGELFYAKRKWTKAVRKYNFFLDNWPESTFRPAAMNRQFEIAKAFLDGEKRRVLKVLKLSAYDEADKIMHGIESREGDTPRSRRAMVTLAQGYQKREKYINAAETWLEVKDLWPAGKIGENALYQMANSHNSAYKGSKFDSTTLLTARSYYNDYKREYTRISIEKGIDTNISEIDEKLAEKQYTIGFHYENAENIHGAKLYYDYIIEKWPDSKAAESAKTRLSVIKTGKTDDLTKRKLPRKAFDIANVFLDSWFGLAHVAKVAKK